jgi:hypothetical protein
MMTSPKAAPMGQGNQQGQQRRDRQALRRANESNRTDEVSQVGLYMYKQSSPTVARFPAGRECRLNERSYPSIEDTKTS